MSGPVKRARRRWRRHADAVRSAADAPLRVKALWLAEAVTASIALAVAGWGLADGVRSIDVDAWPPWLVLAPAPVLGAAVGWGLLDRLLAAAADGHRWAVDRAERHGHVDVTDEDLPVDGHDRGDSGA